MNLVDKIVRHALLISSIVWFCSCATSLKYGAQSIAGSHIEISKRDLLLTLYTNDHHVLHQFGIACGLAYGDKQVSGDMKTPEGEFYVSEVCDARRWSHDFGDGKGEIEGAYGSHFFRLHTPPHTGIGIHGTHLPQSIGTRASEGCVRLNNKDLKELARFIYIGMPVSIGGE